MKTFLPQNQFQNSVTTPPVTDEAVAKLLPLSVATANNSVSVAQPSGAMETEAAVVVRTAAASDISDIPEIFRVANLLCVEAREFQPDYPGIYQAMMDPNAPRATDDVWSDLAPLFLREPS